MDQAVGLVMQVDALGGHVGAKQHPEFRLRVAELFHDLLLILVAHAAVELGDLWFSKFEVAAELLFQKIESVDAFGEDDQAVAGVALLPGERFTGEQIKQRPVFGIAFRRDEPQLRLQ